MLHTSKIEAQDKLGLVILQSIDQNTILLLAGWMMNLQWGVVPYVPTMEVCLVVEVRDKQAAKILIQNYAEVVPEEKKASYNDLIPVIFDTEDKNGMQQAVFDLIALVVKKD